MNNAEYQALYDEITANPDLAPYVVTNDMPKQDAREKDAYIANALNDGQFVVSDVRVTSAGFVSKVGVGMASSIIGKLRAVAQTNIAVELALESLSSEVGLNFGDAELWSAIDSMTDDNNAAMLTTAEATAIKNLGRIPRAVTPAQVSIALRGNAQFTPEATP